MISVTATATHLAVFDPEPNFEDRSGKDWRARNHFRPHRLARNLTFAQSQAATLPAMERNNEHTSHGSVAPGRNGNSRPPNVIENGAISWISCIAIMSPGFLLATELQFLLLSALAIRPDVFAGNEDGMFAAWLLITLLMTSARPTRLLHWIVMAIVGSASLAAATLGWALAVVVLFSVVPQTEFGIAGSVLLGAAAGGVAWLAFRILDRLAGRSSPWSDEEEASDA